MQPPKPFCTPAAPQGGFGLQGLGGGAEGPGSQPASACMESLGSSNLYHSPKLEKEGFLGSPAGFQMAPCGCIFDPRVYQIKRVDTTIGQLSLYELVVVGSGGPAGGPASPSTLLLEPQHHLKVSPLPQLYPHYQPAPGGPQYLMPYFPPEEPGPEDLGFVRDGGPPAFVEPPPPVFTESLGPPPPKKIKVPQLATTISAEAELSPGIYDRLKNRLSQLNGPPEPPAVPIQEPEASCSSPRLLDPLGPGEPEVPAGEAQSLEAATAFLPPEQVPLEDVMRLFDCLLGGAEREGTPSKAPGPALPGSSGGGADPSSDIRSLHLPDKLLSFDYSVPEVLDTMSSVDDLFNFKALEEEPLPHPGLPSVGTALAALQPELPSRRKAGTSAKRGRPRGKARQAAGPRQGRAAAPH
ncbi:Proline-Rich Protein 22 [Manis pentadactyla]|nr:Proline-Rich Protein 22 [Manis pentadactyla]